MITIQAALMVVMLGPVGVIWWRTLQLISTLIDTEWARCPVSLFGYSLSIALSAAGSLCVFFFWPWGQYLLLAGFGGWLFFSRRA